MIKCSNNVNILSNIYNHALLLSSSFACNIQIIKIYYLLYIYCGGTISLISRSYMSNLKSFALSITIGEPHVIA